MFIIANFNKGPNRYLVCAGLAELAMLVLTWIEHSIMDINFRDVVRDTFGIAFGKELVTFFTIIFLASFAFIKIAKKISTNDTAQFLLAGLMYSTLGAFLFMQRTPTNPVYYFPLDGLATYYFPINWLMDFQFFAIAYVFVRFSESEYWD